MTMLISINLIVQQMWTWSWTNSKATSDLHSYTVLWSSLGDMLAAITKQFHNSVDWKLLLSSTKMRWARTTALLLILATLVNFPSRSTAIQNFCTTFPIILTMSELHNSTESKIRYSKRGCERTVISCPYLLSLPVGQLLKTLSMRFTVKTFAKNSVRYARN